MQNNLQMQQIPILAPIYAGTPVPLDFWQIEKFRTIRAIPNAAPSDRFAAVHVCGNSLQNFGILDGDILVFKFADFWQSAYRHRICLWQTPHGITAKFADFTNETIILHNQNGWKQEFEITDCKLIGVVVRVERDL